jgi:hypothetical protein
MRVHHTQNAEAAAAAQATKAQHAAAKQDATKISFAATLAKTSAPSTTGGTTGSNTAPVTTEAPKDTAIPKGPKGEKTEKVKDHPYLEVMSGPRNGMFINTTNNVRRGQAFTMVHKDDRDLHVYGTGKDRRVIISWHKDQPAHKNDAVADTGGTQTSGTTATPNVGVATGTLK